MSLIISEDDYLAHYGILRKSGRYPWGSGQTQHERNKTFLDTVNALKKSGSTDAEIAKMFDSPEQRFTVSDLRNLKTIALNEQKQADISQAQKLKDKGLSNVAIGERMGKNESSVRALLAPGAAEKAQILKSTTDMLRRQVDEKGMVDVGSHVAAGLGLSNEKLATAITALREEGYHVQYPKVPQLGTIHETTLKVLAHPNIAPKEVYAAAKTGGIRGIQEHSYDGGQTFSKNAPVLSVSSKRLQVVYKEDGGDKADGVIYVRPGAKDLDMGHSRYVQARIAIDGTHYLKGMAVIKDDLPDGVDMQFHTNKSNTGNKLDALKKLNRDDTGGIDHTNPFGADFSQLPKYDKHGREINNTTRSAVNRVNEEGQWDKWSKTLSTQFLSKQSPELAREQLDMTYERRKNELSEILRLTNPAIKQKLLETYADEADSAAYKMKAQALPRQRTQVILPLNSLKETEIYAPNFNNGERVVLVRHPHGGKFEIPELTVNNKNREAIRTLGRQPKDAVGIHHKVAQRLSGADFDGDTVLVIPNNAGRIKTERPLAGLKGFDPQHLYGPHDGMKTIDGGTYDAKTKTVDYHGRNPNAQTKQTQMGIVSNLITDMTIKGANHDELAAAVRHSMVVIDAEKHHLDYKRSARENGIPALIKKYQPRAEDQPTGRDGGAATLISRAKKEVEVPRRRGRSSTEGGPIDRVTGERKFTPTGESYVSRRTGKTVIPTEKVNKLLETKSAHELSSGSRIETIYADHSDRIRALANQARRELVNTKSIRVSESAKRTYAPQVESLNHKLAVAVQNSPRERQAQIIANHIYNQKLEANPGLDSADKKKLRSRALLEGRARAGASKTLVDITDDEWKAIQAGAISHSKLEQILNHTDVEKLRERATPRTPRVLSSSQQARAKSMLALGYTQADVAAQLGVSLTTLKNVVINGGEG